MKKKKIGILTYFGSINNGAYLQAFSLQSFLYNRYKNIAVIEIINYESEKAYNLYRRDIENKKVRENVNLFNECKKELFLSKNNLITDKLEDVATYIKHLEYDVVIVGSDEVWKTDGMRGFPNAYWLNYDLGNTVRLSYATSGRNDYSKLNEEEKEYIRSSLSKFKYVGLRDKITEEELSKICLRDYYQNCDPTFLLADYYRQKVYDKRKIKIKRNIPVNKKIILVILLDQEVLSQLYRLFFSYDNYIVIGTYTTSSKNTDMDFYAQSPFDWQELIAISDLVITTLFHGTVFSLIHNKKFISIETATKGRGKIENILKEYELEKDFIYASDYSKSSYQLGLEIFRKALDKIEDEKENSYEWIIDKEKKKIDSFIRCLDKELFVDKIVDELNGRNNI